jgi:hypothetical protein
MIRFRLRSLDAVNAYLKTVPYGALKKGLAAFAKYVLGNTSHGLRHDEPQKYVSRKAAGYKTSAAQRRFFFATGIWESDGRGGVILNRYVRSTETAAAWKATERNNGYAYTFSNAKPGAYYKRSEDAQTRQHELMGARKVSEVIADNYLGAIRSANAEIKKHLKSK